MSKKEEEVKPLKIKVKKPSLKNKNQTHKVDLSKKEETTEEIVKEEQPVVLGDVQESNDKEVVEAKAPETKTEVVAEETKEKVSPISEVIEEKEEVKSVETNKEPVRDIEEAPKVELPENIEKLVSFMKETGGDVQDYVRLNMDYSSVDSDVLLREYYKKTKPHLESDEIDFILEDNFSYDEEVEEERDIKKKKLAYKEEIANAKNFLEETKSKYYDEIKLRPGVTQEQQKAMEFFNKHNKEQEIVAKQHDNFKDMTKKFFTDEFKGFDFDIGEKKFRYGLNNVEDAIDKQSNLSTFVKKFLDDKGDVKDYKGYHKAIYAAQHADTIANHFYEQGKADAVKDVVAKSKNISNAPRQTSSGDVFIGGLKVRAISGVDSSKLKIKTKK